MYDYLEKSIINICRYEYGSFLCKKNVVGIGLGYREIKGIETCEKVIKVMVKKKVPLNSLSENHRILSCYKGIRTDVIETGVCRIKSLTDRIRPVLGGYSIGPAGLDITGTYGGLVTDGTDNYILSNNHVIAVDNLLPLGNPILQPATTYGGFSPRDVVAKLSMFIPIRFSKPSFEPINYVDAAIAKVENPALVSPEIKFIGIPKGTTAPILNMNVQMTGETSELLQGKIKVTHGAITIQYSRNLEALFHDQIAFTPVCDDGDSGALLVDMIGNVVGLNFAGTIRYSVANPIDMVLDKLNVKLVTSNNFSCSKLSSNIYI